MKNPGNTPIRAVEMTWRIREQHTEQLRGATFEERIRFYRDRASRLHASELRGFLSGVSNTSEREPDRI
jgi:hypothetical protein